MDEIQFLTKSNTRQTLSCSQLAMNVISVIAKLMKNDIRNDNSHVYQSSTEEEKKSALIDSMSLMQIPTKSPLLLVSTAGLMCRITPRRVPALTQSFESV